MGFNKTRVARKLIKFEYRTNRGDYWIGWVKRFVNTDKLVPYLTLASLWIPAINESHVAKVTATIVIIIVMILMEVPKYIVGYLDEKKGFQQKMAEMTQNARHLNPYNVWLRDAIVEISKKLGIKDIKSLEEYE